MAGQPTKYRDEYCEQVYKLGLLGALDVEIADFFHVHVDTIHEWARRHAAFSEARARGKSKADANVAERLYSRATGHSHPAVKILQYEGEPVIIPYTEVYPPDTQAATWWLKNRRPADWADRQEITGKGGGPVIIRTGVVRDGEDTG